MVQRSTINRLKSPYLDRAAIKSRETIVAVMADDLRTLAASAGSIVADDMELLGWTPAQINANGADARRRAIAQSVR